VRLDDPLQQSPILGLADSAGSRRTIIFSVLPTSSVVPRPRNYGGQVAGPRREALARLKPRVSPRALGIREIKSISAVGALESDANSECHAW
jgi:hypothetical protein